MSGVFPIVGLVNLLATPDAERFALEHVIMPGLRKTRHLVDRLECLAYRSLHDGLMTKQEAGEPHQHFASPFSLERCTLSSVAALFTEASTSILFSGLSSCESMNSSAITRASRAI